MIGYSDSGKDAGRLAAAWGLYEVQVRPTRLTLWARRLGCVGRATAGCAVPGWCAAGPRTPARWQAAGALLSCLLKR